MVLPSLITVLAICAGLSAIRLAFESHFEAAVSLILVACLLDGIDGRLARALHATSRFGAEMDSLADIVNFGVAPALVLHAFLLHEAGPLGWIAAVLFAIACGLRLARFNVLAGTGHERGNWQAEYFVGVPAPAGALLVLLPMYLVLGGLQPDRTFAVLGSGYTIMVAYLLVSRMPVFSGKAIGGRIPFFIAIMVMSGLLGYAMPLFNYAWYTLTASALAYLVFLPLSALAYSRRARIEDERKTNA